MTIPTAVQRAYEVHGTDTWTMADVLLPGPVYLIVLFTGKRTFSIEPPSLTGWSDILWQDGSGGPFNVDGVPTRVINNEESPNNGQMYFGLAQYSGPDPVEFTWSGAQSKAGAVLIWEVAPASAVLGFGFDSDTGMTDMVTTQPELVIADSESRVFRVVGVFPSNLSPSATVTMVVDYGDSPNGVLGGFASETSLLPWTAPEQTTLIEFTYPGSEDGTWIGLTIQVSGSPVQPVSSGWYVGQIGWGTR